MRLGYILWEKSRVFQQGLIIYSNSKNERDDRSVFFVTRFFWSGEPGLNRRPSAWEADVLPTELPPQVVILSKLWTFIYLELLNASKGGWHGLGAPHTIIGNPIMYGGKSVPGPTSFVHLVITDIKISFHRVFLYNGFI